MAVAIENAHKHDCGLGSMAKPINKASGVNNPLKI